MSVGKTEAPPIHGVGNDLAVRDGIKDKKEEKGAVQVGFDDFIEPFVALLNRVKGRIERVVVFIRWVIDETKNGIYESLSAIYTVFHRLIIPPKFDPESLKFSKKLDELKENFPKLHARFLEFQTQKFTADYMLLRDLKELHKLNSEIHQTYELLTTYAQGTGRPVPPLKIHERVVAIKADYKMLEQERLDFIKSTQEPVLDKFLNLARLFIRPGVPIPKDIYHDFLKIFNEIKAELDVEAGCKKKLEEATGQMKLMSQLADGNSMNVKPSKDQEPLKLRNIGNSCYIDSVIQSLLCVKDVVENLRQPLEKNNLSDEQYEKIVAVQKELLKFTYSFQDESEDNLTLTEFILMIARGKKDASSQYRLRGAIFDSGLNLDFDEAELEHQHDAAQLMMLIADNLLSCCRFKIEEHKTIEAFKELEFIGARESSPMLKVDIPESNKDLAELIDLALNTHEEALGKFDPKDGKLIDKKETNPHLKAEIQETDYFCNRRLIDLPPVLLLHLNRSGFDIDTRQPFKVNHSVKLPKNGIIDLTKYHAPETPGQSKKAMYRIKSFVEHDDYGLGGLNFGHYVNYQEQGGKYYLCDDQEPDAFIPVSKAHFFSRTDPYLVVMERLTPKEVVQAEAEARKAAEEAAKRAEAAKKKAEQEKNKKP